MNKEIIMQIVEESKGISDEQLNFSHWYKEQNGVVTMCPIGWHILNHPKAGKLLKVKSEAIRPPKGPAIKTWTFRLIDLEHYLNMDYPAVRYLFNNPSLTRQRFVNTATAFVEGKLDIRECAEEDCWNLYVTSPSDNTDICPTCKTYLLERCGIYNDTVYQLVATGHLACFGGSRHSISSKKIHTTPPREMEKAAFRAKCIKCDDKPNLYDLDPESEITIRVLSLELVDDRNYAFDIDDVVV